MHQTKSEIKSKDELLVAVENCTSIAELFALVKHEKIDIRMQTMNDVSSLYPKKPDIPSSPGRSPLDKLKLAVKSAVLRKK